jgi:hypothetical protein
VIRASCIGIAALIARRRSGLTEAERLRLEAHFAECAGCRTDAIALDRLGAISDRVAASAVRPAARARAIERAIENAPRAAPPAARRPRAWAFAGAALSLIAVAAIAGTVSRSGGERDRAPVAAPPKADTAEARITAGQIEREGGSLGQDAAVPAGERLYVSERARIDLRGARIELSPGSEVAWIAAAAPAPSGIRLFAGAIDVEVDPAPQRAVRVIAERFVVDLIGASARIDPSTVEVHRGSVRVTGRDGAVLADRLEAGHSYEWSAEARPEAAVPPVRKKGSARLKARPGRARAPEAPEVAVSSEDPAILLARARGRLADRDSASARELIDRALSEPIGRGTRAEGETLLAEADLLDGRLEAAVRSYDRIATEYVDLAAGENAMFAKARIEAKAGKLADARATLRAYLERHPRGRFAEESKAELGRLGEKGGR